MQAPFCNKAGRENNGAVVLILKEFRCKRRFAVTSFAMSSYSPWEKNQDFVTS